MDKILISVVIAAKNPNSAKLDLCLASFAALESAPKIQIVIVVSGESPAFYKVTMGRFRQVKVLNVPANGVYAAYNEGIKISNGNYLLFFGIDDMALPAMDLVIEQLQKLVADKQSCHLFASACYMQSVGIAMPSYWRTSLIFRNWCHQGIFYLRDYLVEHNYQTEYIVQADHKMNIDVVSNRALNFLISKEVVAYFSAGGISSLIPDVKFRKDFSQIVSNGYGWHYGFLVRVKQMIIDAILGDPLSRFKAKLRR